ncbi:glycosyltransferase, partial [archaeon]|nr:glycosyltransferase [archaeon]
GLVTVFRDWLRLGRLLHSPRIDAPDKGPRRALYLKTNLWLGVQAGGSVAHTSGVIKGLLDSGGEIDFFSAETPIALPKIETLKINPIKSQNTYVIPRELNHYRHNRLFIQSASSHLKDSEGFIYQRLSLGNYAGVILSRRHHLPLVIEYNGSESWLANNWGTPLTLEKLAMRAENACLRHAHLLVTVSDVLRNELIGRGVEAERIVSYPNGVDTDQFSPDRFTRKETAMLRKRYGISEDSIVVTFVGTFGPWHGAEVFAEALRKIFKQDSKWLKTRKLHFMFIGDGGRRPVVEDLTAGKGLQEFVTVTGLIEQEKTPLHLAASNILVSPHVENPDGSPFFGSPTKLFEYLASGRPVIASDLGQIGEVLDGCPHVGELVGNKKSPPKGASGILIKPEAAEELASAITVLVDNPQWRKTMGLNARRLALDRYTWNHHVGAVLEGVERVRTINATAAPPRVRLLFNGLHSKSGGGLTYLNNILPIMARDSGVDLHLCVHEDQRTLLPNNLENITVHFLNFRPGFWHLQVREQIDIPRLAKKIGAGVTFSPANYGPLLTKNSVILLRNALSVAFVERRLVKLGYWALVYLGTFLSLLVSRRAITVSNYAKSAASGGLIGIFGNRFTVVPHGVSNIFSPPKKGAGRENFLLAVSDLYVQKNFKNLISAMARLASEHPELTLKIAGRTIDEDYFSDLKQAVVANKLEG